MLSFSAKRLVLVLCIGILFASVNAQYINYTTFDFEGESMLPIIGTGSLTVIGGATYSWTEGMVCGGETWGFPELGGTGLSVANFPKQHMYPETAGIQINVPTTGYKYIQVVWDQFTKQGSADMNRIQYTVDGENWLNFEADEYNAVNKIYDTMPPWYTRFNGGLFPIASYYTWTHRSVNFINVEGVDDNPNFAMRIVTAFTPGTEQYGSDYNPESPVLFDNIQVNYHSTDIVPIPYATPRGSVFTEPVTVTLSNVLRGVSFYYTTDYTDPSRENGILYTGPITISESTPIRAIAVLDGMTDSGIIDEGYNIAVPIRSISEMVMPFGGPYIIMSEVTITTKFNSYAYNAQDFSGAMQIMGLYDFNPNIGDTFIGLIGRNTYNLFNLFNQDIKPISTGTEILPIEITIAELIDNYPSILNKKIAIRNMKFVEPTGVFEDGKFYPITDGTGTFNFRVFYRNVDYIGEPIPEGLHDLIGYIWGPISAIDYAYVTVGSLTDITRVTSIDDVVETSANRLFGNYPNPFNPITTISFELAKESQVSIDIFNIKGQKVKSLVNTKMNGGRHSVVWNGTDDNETSVGTGVYLYRLKAGEYQSVKRMMLIK